MQVLKKLDYQFLNKLKRVMLFLFLAMCYTFVLKYHGKPIVMNAIDGVFHVERILSLETILKSPINYDYFNHNGPVVNLFYPWLIVYPMYFFMVLTKSILGGYYLYMFMITYITLEICYWISYKITNKTNVSIIFALVYSFTLIRTTNFYCRFALGEAVAMTFLPLIFYGIYQVFYQEKPKYWILTIGMTGVVYTHMISFYMSCLFVGFFLILNIIKRNINKEKILALLKAIGTTILLTLAFFIPMLQIYATTKIEPPMEYHMGDTSDQVSKFILDSLDNQTNSTDVLGIVGLILFALIIFRFKKLNTFCKDSVIIAIIFTLLTTKLVPWAILNPIFKVVQFPWRFLVITALISSFVGIVTLSDWLNSKVLKKLFIIGSCFIIGMHWSTVYLDRGDKNVPGMGDSEFIKEIKIDYATFNGSGDYRPEATNKSFTELWNRQVRVGKEWQSPKKVKFNANKITYEIKNTNNSKTVILPVWKYPGEIVIHNGTKVDSKVAYNGATEVPVNKGYNKYVIYYEYTNLAKLGFIISVGSALLFILFNIIKRFKLKK